MSKLPIFLFAVLFISGYHQIFRPENSIVGVILLMGLLMFMKADFGISSVYSGAMIPLLFVTMGLFAKWSTISPWLALLLDPLFLGTVFLATRLDESRSLYLPFAMGYLMFRGYDVSGELFTLRMISLAGIGLLIGLLHWRMNCGTCCGETPRALLAPLSRWGSWERWLLMLLGTLAPTMFVGDFLSIPKSMWVNLTILSLLTPMEEDFVRRRRFRIPATILGCMLFLVLFDWLIPQNYQTMATLLAGFLSMFLTSYFMKTIYNSFSALVTATLLLPTRIAVLTRICNNLIGAAICLASVLVFRLLFRRWDAQKLCDT